MQFIVYIISLLYEWMVCPTVLMKQDRREWFANPQDGNGLRFHWILREWDGNGISGTGQDGTGFHFHSRVPLYHTPGKLLLTPAL